LPAFLQHDRVQIATNRIEVFSLVCHKPFRRF
jgi:hypothetical protein